MATSNKIDAELKDRIKRLAQPRDRSSHWMMREAILDYVAREEQQASFKQDAVATFEAYQVNGRHLTLEEADAWLAKLKAGEDVAKRNRMEVYQLLSQRQGSLA